MFKPLFTMKNGYLIIDKIVYDHNMSILLTRPTLVNGAIPKKDLDNKIFMFLKEKSRNRESFDVLIAYSKILTDNEIPFSIRCQGDYVFYDGKCIFQPYGNSTYIPDELQYDLFRFTDITKLKEIEILDAIG